MEGEIKPTEQSTRMKRRLIWALTILVLVAGFLLWKPFGKNKEGSKTPADSAFNRDEPAKDQLLQDDYKAKIKSMLDSGMSVPEISRETGIRKDVIRKIKKEMGKGEGE